MSVPKSGSMIWESAMSTSFFASSTEATVALADELNRTIIFFLKKTETRTAPRGASAGRFPNEEKLTTGRRWPRHASTAPAGAVRRGEPPVRHRGKSSSVC
jgi:hypothetical protein